MSTSTAAPAALALSEGWKVLTKGTATAATPAPPTAQVATIQFLFCWSTAAPSESTWLELTLAWVMKFLQELA
jgi:hypothetical protein